MYIALADSGFLQRSAKKLQKCTLLYNLSIITREGNMETRQMTPMFSSAFSALFETFIFVFENSQNSQIFILI